MRTYGSIQTCFWENPSVQKLSDQGKLLVTYLFTGLHTNMIGCFRLPAGYITEDLSWDIQKVKNTFCELSEMNFITRDEKSGWLIIHDFLKWNPVQNHKQAKGIQKIFDSIPNQSSIINLLIQNLLNHGKYFETEFINRLRVYENNGGNRFDTLSKKPLTDKEQNQEQDTDQNQETLSSLREDVVSTAIHSTVTNRPSCPHEEIINLYHQILHMCPPIRIWNKTRRGYLKQRWNENSKHQNLLWWQKYFEHAKQSEFLTGKVSGRDGKPPFVVDLEWLVRPNNFAKVIEGKYHGVRS